MASQRLSVRDSIHVWVDKINDALNLQNVDGAFMNVTTSWSDTTLTLSGGSVRLGSHIVEISGKPLVLPSNKKLVVGVNTIDEELTYYTFGNEPDERFIPIYVAITNNSRIIDLQDVRTWAYEDRSADTGPASVTAHENKSNPHPQYTTANEARDEAREIVDDTINDMPIISFEAGEDLQVSGGVGTVKTMLHAMTGGTITSFEKEAGLGASPFFVLRNKSSNSSITIVNGSSTIRTKTGADYVIEPLTAAMFIFITDTIVQQVS